MMDWKSELKRIIENLSTGGDLVIIGVGNPLRGDDGVGVELARTLKRSLRSERVKVLIAEDKVDMIPGMLEKMDPNAILILDAADFGGRPGEIRIMKLDESSGRSISTHDVPLSLLLSVAGISAPAYVLGIQVETLKFGEGLSSSVKKAMNEAASFLLNLLAREILPRY